MLLVVEQVLWRHHHHLYVGSGTAVRDRNSRGGVKSRASDRDKPTLKHSYFHHLLRDKKKPREPVWSVIWQIKGSQAERDVETRTYNRFLSYIAETLFHDLLPSWKDSPDRPSA